MWAGERLMLQAKRVLANLVVGGLLGGFFYGLTMLYNQAPTLLHDNCSPETVEGQIYGNLLTWSDLTVIVPRDFRPTLFFQEIWFADKHAINKRFEFDSAVPST